MTRNDRLFSICMAILHAAFESNNTAYPQRALRKTSMMLVSDLEISAREFVRRALMRCGYGSVNLHSDMRQARHRFAWALLWAAGLLFPGLHANAQSCYVWQDVTTGAHLSGQVASVLGMDMVAFYQSQPNSVHYTYLSTTCADPPSSSSVNCVVNAYVQDINGGASQQWGVNPAQVSGSQCPQYFVNSKAPPENEICSRNCVNDPINPAMGNVYATEEDLKFAGAGAIAFRRYYDSAGVTSADLSVGWRHSYDRHITTVYEQPQSIYVASSATVSPEYTSASLACTSGVPAIQASVPAWVGATVTFGNNVCVVSSGGRLISTVPIQSYPTPTPPSTPVEYDVVRDDGQVLRYTMQNGVINNPPGTSIRFAVTGAGFTVTDDDDSVETYNVAGALQTITSRGGVVQTLSYSSGVWSGVTDSFGNAITVARNLGNIGSITVAGGGTVTYGYDTTKRLTTATYADSTYKTYVYGDSRFPNALTEIDDENRAAFVSWSYDAQERGKTTQNAGGVNYASLVYNADGSVTATDALGAVRSFSYVRAGDKNKVTSISGSQCPTCEESAATTYDSAGWVASRTDYNARFTCYANDPVRGLELVRVEGFQSGDTCPANLSTYAPTAVQRKVTTQWSTIWREPSLITESNRTTGFTFDASGNILTKVITDTRVTSNAPRTWTYTYNSYGQVLTVVGPRTDVLDKTTYTYYTCATGAQCGQIQTITNAVGQVTTFNTYNAYGQPLTITDPNGVVTTLTYDARARLKSSQVGTETTSYTYYPTGLLNLVTLPDSSTLQFTYDGAHRLTKMTDGAGNYIQYTLDALGNRTAENTYDPTNTLRRTHTRVFNALSEMTKDINAAGTAAVTTNVSYDNNGNPVTISAPLSRSTTQYTDPLYRVSQIIDPAGGYTNLGYDSTDHLANLTDPRNLLTHFSHNGFEDLIKLVSPDTGTSTMTYDSGGNLATATDARGAKATFTYDAMNRATQVAYTDQTIQWTYDAGTNGKGRLTGASDANHSMSWSYDTRGRVTGKGQTVASITKSVGYAYTNGDLSSLVTPSGQTITYGYSNHRITSMTVNGTTLLSGVTYDPFGPVTGWTWGNNSTVSRAFDGDGNPRQIVTAGVTNGYTVDNASRITGISDSGLSSNTWTFGFDALDRVTTGSSSALSRGYSYDANSNQLTTTGTVAFTDTIASTSNRLSSTAGAIARTYGYDAAGNTTSYGSNSYTFNQRGRLSQATVSGSSTNYLYNALGQLIQKSGNGGTTLLMYDESGHLLGEYTSSGALIQETVWMGDTPVATLQPRGSSIATYYVHADHLGTPRKITRPSDNGLMWRWDPDTFGSVAPNSNPASLGTFVYNLRFPGQYALSESGLYYNYFRIYDPQVGRYIESDPIGLAGGINPYAYALGNPVSNTDPLGLESGAAFTALMRAEGFKSPGPLPRHCVTPPPAPPGANIDNNINVFGGASIFNVGADLAAANLMRRRGDWDYRTNLGQQYDDFGNFNYGAIAATMGLPYYVTQNLAGLYQGNSPGRGTPFNIWPYGDDVAGALQIQAGYDYVAGQCGCGK